MLQAVTERLSRTAAAPLPTEPLRQRALGRIRYLVEAGAQVRLGGSSLPDDIEHRMGWRIPPTVLMLGAAGSPAALAEQASVPLGPVLGILSWDNVIELGPRFHRAPEQGGHRQHLRRRRRLGGGVLAARPGHRRAARSPGGYDDVARRVAGRRAVIIPAAQIADRRRTEASMDFVFVIDDIAGLKPCHDRSSVALMEAAQLHPDTRILITTAARLGYTDGHATALCCPVTLQPAVRHEHQWIIDPEWFKLGPASLYRLGDAAAVFMRTDPPVDAQYLRATYLLDLVDATRTLMVNSPSGVRNANEKLFALRVPELGPPTLVTGDRQAIRATLAEWGRAVLKPTGQRHG